MPGRRMAPAGRAMAAKAVPTERPSSSSRTGSSAASAWATVGSIESGQRQGAADLLDYFFRSLAFGGETDGGGKAALDLVELGGRQIEWGFRDGNTAVSGDSGEPFFQFLGIGESELAAGGDEDAAVVHECRDVMDCGVAGAFGFNS